MDGTRGIAEALLAGRMQLVSREDDGTGGSVLGFGVGAARLTRRELAVLAAAESGVANKFVALEQSLAYSTVSEALQMAISKLGFFGRTEFLKVMACLRFGNADSGLRVLGTTESCWVVLPVETPGLDVHLTHAERQVVAGVLDGRTNLAIATARRTSSRTVANQLAAIYRKLGVSSRWELAARAGRTQTVQSLEQANDAARAERRARRSAPDRLTWPDAWQPPPDHLPRSRQPPLVPRSE